VAVGAFTILAAFGAGIVILYRRKQKTSTEEDGEPEPMKGGAPELGPIAPV
jgi:hypothetical protein